ncbi:DNA repair exonuclease SbcCD nuclease subunit [Desulfosalsimonas propionicica]|uniref:DNA repair exonuclease SbcCD nuclease subunit n=1 Tax=Desulfosalsimonas propionicica TaxID=332175 RepID=A0A7W0HJT0_9BACT|nr:DNA repair exonuclease [Desulfosalsimonas propionicica]MBA2880564.1 DNA repair exonuclease SbcCD nuclease subunit [Desulfosalsimonas propionicica]
MFTFIHAADIHLDSPMHKLEAYDGAPVEEFRLSTRRAFENLVELALGQQVSFILISGDLYDGDWKDYNTGLYFINQMVRLQKAGIRVFVTAGNHDAASTITRSLRMPDNVTLFAANRAETATMDDPAVAIHGRSFAAPAEKNDLSADYPASLPGRFNIGMLHTCATGRPGHEAYAPCSPARLAQTGYQYWALGHVHDHEVLNRDPFIVFPGNTQGRHIREAGPKGCVLVTVTDSTDIDLAFTPTDVVRWCLISVDAGGSHDAREVISAFAGQLETVISENNAMPLAVRVEIIGETKAAGELAADPERWTGEIRAAAIETGAGRVWVEKVRFFCRLPADVDHPPSGGAMEELVSLFEDLAHDPEARTALGSELSDFCRKLPIELRQDPDGIKCDDPDWIKELLDQIRPELVGRLMGKGERS